MFPDLSAPTSDPTSDLRDIQVILGHPWWPPGPGWWLLAVALAGLLWLAWRYRSTWRLHLPLLTLGDWRWEAGRALQQLRREAVRGEVKPAAAALSELLRRIAMARHGRAACAGLHGADWLDWLARHDPNGFDWRAQGRLLIAAPYAPPPSAATTAAARRELEQLLAATRPWITTRLPRRRVVRWWGRGWSGRIWPGRVWFGRGGWGRGWVARLRAAGRSA